MNPLWLEINFCHVVLMVHVVLASHYSELAVAQNTVGGNGTEYIALTESTTRLVKVT